MSPQLKAVVAFMLVLGACDRGEPQKIDPMSEAAAGTIRRTLNCEAKDSEGNCLQKSCKKDDQGDCRTYAGYCLDAGHHWSGTNDGGKCSVVL